jgi:hypothetical protein
MVRVGEFGWGGGAARESNTKREKGGRRENGHKRKKGGRLLAKLARKI